MEITGINSDGKFMKSNVSDFAKNMKKPDELMTMGTSPTTFVYTDRGTGGRREMDLKEAAQVAGLRNVQFNFNSESAKKQGFIADNGDVDNGVAYNIERIKSEPLRRKYLADKGYQNVFREGDIYYGLREGKMYPINNREGVDMSDFTRMFANIGRDAGSTAAVTAAIGGGAVAALGTGGATLAGGVAVSGAAGAAGGAVGETLQRGIESVLGTESSKYNKELSSEEEMASLGESALIGGVTGIAQPLLVAGGAKLMGAAAKGTKNLTGEFAQKATARLEAGALNARLPQGFMQKFASSEEAAAAQEMAKAGAMYSKGTLSSKGLGEATSETKEMLARGAAKPIARDGAEEAAQQGLRSQWESRVLKDAAGVAEHEALKKETALAMEKHVAVNFEKNKANAKDVFSSHKKHLETLFDPESDLEMTKAAKETIVNDAIKKIANGKRLQIDYEPGTKVVRGISEESWEKYQTGEFSNIFKGADDYLTSFRANNDTLDLVPDDAMKKGIVDQLTWSGRGLKGQSKERVDGLIASINDHSIYSDTSTIKKTFDEFNAFVRTSSDSKDLEPLSWAVQAIEQYEMAGSTNQATVKSFYSGQNKFIEMGQIVSDPRKIYDQDITKSMFGGMADLARSTGDVDGVSTRNLIEAAHLKNILDDAPGSGVKDLLDPQSKSNFDALQFVRRYDDYSSKMNILSSSSEQGKKRKASTFMMAAAATKIAGGSWFEALSAGHIAVTGGASMLKNSSILQSGLKKAGGAAKALSSGASQAGKVGSAIVSKAAGSGRARTAATAIGTEEAVRKIKRPK